MPAFRFPHPFYAIVDTLGQPELSYTELAQQICAGGAKLLQLRVKEHSTRDFLTIAQQVRTICRHYDCLLIINDRADVALAVDADGAHLGQDDLPVGAARRVLGSGKVIGVSTHDPEQARAAAREGADYIGFGPLFGTQTKETGYTARGLEQLQEIRRLVRIPIVAIGGITIERAPLVLTAGADAVAMISEIVRAPDVAARVAVVMRTLTAPPH
ncbi:MAG: thiamine phosphate synthase [Candidatus Binatia bacterium]|nr:thiamine phosphate synthase [Candidatus Binatia bacterium]